MATVIKVIDSIMGSGKTSAMINMMNEAPPDKRFMFVTPYLDEVDRVAASLRRGMEACVPKDDAKFGPKLAQLKGMVKKHKSVVTTHALYLMFDLEVLELLKSNHYTLIIDETLDEMNTDGYDAHDYELALSQGFIRVDAEGAIHWTDKYKGHAFDALKEQCPAFPTPFGNTYVLMSPVRWQLCDVFDDVYVMTYMFKAQTLWGLYKIRGYEFEYYYACKEEGRHIIKKGREHINGNRFRDLIDLYGAERYTGRYTYADKPLSYTRLLGKCSDEAYKEMRNSLANFYGNICHSSSGDNLWTTFKEARSELSGGGYARGFAAINSKATNKYGDRHNVAYMADRYLNPFLDRYFKDHGIEINEDAYALSSMLQFIWRSAIRNGEPIKLFVPSRRMRCLLKQWLNDPNAQVRYRKDMLEPKLITA